MANWKTAKAKDLVLAGVEITSEWNGSQCNSITFNDGNGGRILVRGSYGVSVEVAAPPVMVKKWTIKCESAPDHIAIKPLWDDQYTAQNAASEMPGEWGAKAVEVEVPE